MFVYIDTKQVFLNLRYIIVDATEALQDQFILGKNLQGEPKFKTFGKEKNLLLGIMDSYCGKEPAGFCVFPDFYLSWLVPPQALMLKGTCSFTHLLLCFLQFFIVRIETSACSVNICVKPDKQLIRGEAVSPRMHHDILDQTPCECTCTNCRYDRSTSNQWNYKN